VLEHLTTIVVHTRREESEPCPLDLRNPNHDNGRTELEPFDAWREHILAMKFRIGSIPVQVQPSFFVASAMLGWRGETADVAIWVAVCFVSILVHEMGHALVIARFGGTPRVLLYPGGGLTYGDKSKTPGRRILVSLAGPGAGFVFAGVVFALARLHPLHGMQQTVYGDLMWVNMSWGLFNLVPMLPLDGGNMFESLIALR